MVREPSFEDYGVNSMWNHLLNEKGKITQEENYNDCIEWRAVSE